MGMKCDARGNLYVTRYDKGVIAVFSPRGKLLREIAMKGKKNEQPHLWRKRRSAHANVTLQDRKCVETFLNEIPGKVWR